MIRNVALSFTDDQNYLQIKDAYLTISNLFCDLASKANNELKCINNNALLFETKYG